MHILIYIITRPVNLNQYRGTVGASNSRYLIRFGNSYQHVKCHLNDIDIAFSVTSFSCSILTTIFNSQPNLLIESSVHPSLHPNFHHQIVYAKFNLGIVYPPSYER